MESKEGDEVEAEAEGEAEETFEGIEQRRDSFLSV